MFLKIKDQFWVNTSLKPILKTRWKSQNWSTSLAKIRMSGACSINSSIKKRRSGCHHLLDPASGSTTTNAKSQLMVTINSKLRLFTAHIPETFLNVRISSSTSKIKTKIRVWSTMRFSRSSLPTTWIFIWLSNNCSQKIMIWRTSAKNLGNKGTFSPSQARSNSWESG